MGDEDNDDEDNSENDDDDDENEGDEDEDDDDDNGSQKSKRSYNLRANKPRTHFYNVPVVGKALCIYLILLQDQKERSVFIKSVQNTNYYVFLKQINNIS